MIRLRTRTTPNLLLECLFPARLHKLAPILISLFCLTAINHAVAGPWIEPGNERTRHHLQNLVDSGASTTLVTTWPLMWSRVNQELKKIDPLQLSPSAIWSYQYLKHEFKKESRTKESKQSLYIGNVAPAIRDFSNDSRNQQEASFNVSYTGEQGAFKINASYVRDANDDIRTQYDGSHFTYLKGNWALGIGAIDRWWGPGWESSLILSNNARPTPSLFIQRNLAEPFESPLLSWLGPWQLTTFMSQLESDRGTPDALLWGMRVNFRPIQSLEIGLSRTAMWGGDNRPSDLKTFFRLLTGKDNYSDPEDKITKEPGNQMAGVDWRWGTHIGSIRTAFYGQLIGEDEAGGLPSRHIGLAGAEINGTLFETQTRLSIEAQNTTVYFYDGDKKAPNVAYEHPLYPSGYRYKGLPIGASTDNDSESISIRSQSFFRNGHSAHLALSKHNINMDGGDRQAPAGNIHGETQTKTYQVQLNYTMPLLDHLKIQTGVFYFSNDLSVQNQKIGSGAFIQLNTRW